MKAEGIPRPFLFTDPPGVLMNQRGFTPSGCHLSLRLSLPLEGTEVEEMGTHRLASLCQTFSHVSHLILGSTL